MEGEGNSRELDQTPTWAVASVCGIIILISILLEMGLHHIGKWFTKRHKKALFEALEKVKAELMVLGFVSLILTFGQSYIPKVCIPQRAAATMLPCHLKEKTMVAEGGGTHRYRRRILWNEVMASDAIHRILVEGSSGPSCPKGKVSLVSLNGLHQLHIFIFFLAVFHVVYSALTMALGKAKTRGWKEWEKETSSPGYEFSHDPSRFRSVRKADYLALREGFINAYLAPQSKFDFQKYIKRTLENDFKVVVGISPVLWTSAVVYLLINVHGWETLFWLSLLPLIIILAVGTKLQAIITKMAIDIQEKHAVIQGVPLVELSDNHFWFGRPRLILFLIHFILFQNAFEITYFFWIWYEFGLKSCFHERFNLIVVKVCLGVGVQFLCSYITLPLYALVSQMGSHMKLSIFNEQTSMALKRWKQAAKKRRLKVSPRSSFSTPRTSVTSSPFHVSAIHPLPYTNVGDTDKPSKPSLARSYSEQFTSVTVSGVQSPPPGTYLFAGYEDESFSFGYRAKQPG